MFYGEVTQFWSGFINSKAFRGFIDDRGEDERLRITQPIFFSSCLSIL